MTAPERFDWIWYGVDENGDSHVSLGRWQKHPCQFRYKFVEIQPTEHDHTRADLSHAAIAAKNAQILDLIEALRKRSNGEICGCGVDNPTDVCLSHYDVIEAVVRNRVQAAIAAAMMGALDNFPADWRERAEEMRGVFKMQKAWSDGFNAARAALAASIPTDATAALGAVKAQVRDEVLRSAAIAAGNAIVAIAADADPDISPLRKQMLRVKMEKAVKAALNDAYDEDTKK